MNYTDEIFRLQAEIDEHHAQVTDLEAEVVDLRQQLTAFEGRYTRLVVPLETRLQAVREAIAELERSTRWQAGTHPLGEERPQEDFWQPPEGYVSVEEQYRRAWSPDARSDEGDYVIRPKPQARSLDPAETDIRKLYRALARRYHPDMTTDPDERSQRNDLMAQINDAYARRDLPTLQALARQPEGLRPEQPLAALRLEELRQISRQLRDRISALRLEKAEIQHSDIMRLSLESKLAASRGRDLLAEMVRELERDYEDALLRLERLRRR
ncbi:MAG: J domain-containing protein [Anaerolineae bacterium]|nr:J domain-containing protein [Anaerolineae bacterium]